MNSSNNPINTPKKAAYNHNKYNNINDLIDFEHHGIRRSRPRLIRRPHPDVKRGSPPFPEAKVVLKLKAEPNPIFWEVIGDLMDVIANRIVGAYEHEKLSRED